VHHRPNYLRLGQILIHLDVITHQEVIEARKVQMIEQKHLASMAQFWLRNNSRMKA
jgi:hypothetical protein